ncbi:hypothetical protein J2Z83_002031 [Virgibacillus natechei]|uniref:Uncharacterized protein n=1 Tax=Virgibacillus natechei TaxID=1216297 RepID=A0ABS4IGD2_9BACI|nr:hypothetical protein [Virgibacillus natechei]MBP1969923.1 hypothetical protein [Virgibacillus natechei]UZD13412.1 hypothetical protein OLD84_02300 [Virgibacillus natechei]
MSEEKQHKIRKNLRVLSPDLYRYITSKFEEFHNIHTYDVQVDVIKKETGLHIQIRFGDQFAHAEEQFFTFEAIEEPDAEFEEFVKSTADACQKVMVADYFKMMKP